MAGDGEQLARTQAGGIAVGGVNAVAEVYADALFSLAKEQGAEVSVGEELEALAGAFAREPEGLAMLASPAVPDAAKEDLLRRFGEAGASGLTLRFLRLLCGRHRIRLFAQIAAAFQQFRRAESGALVLMAQTAAPVGAADRVRWEKLLAARFGRPVEVEWSVAPELIGGIRLVGAETVWDGSIRGKLDRLAESIADGLADAAG